jgi:uncharacterized protein
MMKQLPFLFFWLFSVTLLAQDIPAPPNPPRLVNDFAGVLSTQEREALERKLVAFDDSTSNQISIVIVKSLGGYDISEYTFALGRQWGIGQRGKNNGILLVWSPSDRSYFIAPGYGLEGAIPDVIAGRIGDQYLAPNFKNNQFYQGLDEATTALMQRASGEFTADPDSRRNTQQGQDSGPPVFLIIIIIFIIIWLFNRRNRGGGNRGNRGGWGGPVFFPYSTFGGSGSRSGGNFGGGGFGGGGFGGFGGGSFGGGGAGGKY